MFRQRINQLCKKCGGSGVSNKVLTDDRGNVLLAPPYAKGEGDKPQYVPCKECNGEGMALADAPATVMVEGEKVELAEVDRRSRFNDTLSA